MARPRLQKTLADYLAIGVTPILIMLLVGSLVFFLQELAFDGQRFESGTRWILFWYVVGSVLVARIAVKSGRAYASTFTIGLCIAVCLAVFKFVPEKPWVPLIGLGIIWWCTDKLTWDCTLIDESEDASGEGLLKVAGVEDEAVANQETDATKPNETQQPINDEPSETPQPEKIPLWQRVFQKSSERTGKPHAPGLWVVYFSLAALPIFGFGQAAISSADVESRDFAFRCLVVYVGAGLGLLLLTSFLGLRRYLRQRNLEMPNAMAATWVGFGSLIAFGILVTCLLLPRPDGEYDVTDLIDKASEKIQEASDYAMLDDDGGQGEGKQSGEADQNAKQGAAQNKDPNQKGEPGGKKGDNPEAKPGDQKGENGKPQQNGDSDQQGDQQGGKEKQPGDQNENQENNSNENANDKNADQNDDKNKADNNEGDPKDADDQPANDQQPNEENAQQDGEESDAKSESESQSDSSSDSSSFFDKIGTLFKFIVYGIVACVGLYFLWRNWAAVCSFLSRLWNELLSVFGRSNRDESDQEADGDEASVAPTRPFSAFSNPFRTGAAQQLPPNELVRYTFEALQAWAFENNCGRSSDQTPSEFGQRLSTRKLSFASEANEVSQLYARVAYASHRATDSNVRTLEKLWRKLKA